MTIYEQGQQLPPHETCDDCANPMWCKIQRQCSGHRSNSAAAAQRLREMEFTGYMDTMREFGIVEMHEAAPQGQFAFTGTKEQWIAFLNSVEESWKEM